MQILQQKCQRKSLRSRGPGLEVENKPRRHAQTLISLGRTVWGYQSHPAYFIQAGSPRWYWSTQLLAYWQAWTFLSVKRINKDMYSSYTLIISIKWFFCDDFNKVVMFFLVHFNMFVWRLLSN
jgi:hypothetical protein